MDNWAKVRSERERLRTGLARLGLPALPSETNFVLACVPPDAFPGHLNAGTDGESSAANALYRALKERDVHVRWFAEPRLADRLRISVGTREENDRLLATLASLLAVAPRD